MKLIFLTLFVSFNAFAVAWFPVGKPEANTNYAEKSVCEEKESHPCHNVAECPLEVCDLIDGELVHNSDKAFARELTEKNASEAARAKEEKCKAFSFKGTTIAQLRAELNEWAGECKK